MAAHRSVMDLRELAELADGYVAAARVKMSSCAIEPKSSFPPASVQESDEDPSSCAAVGGRRAPFGKKLCCKHVKFGEKAHGCPMASHCCT